MHATKLDDYLHLKLALNVLSDLMCDYPPKCVTRSAHTQPNCPLHQVCVQMCSLLRVKTVKQVLPALRSLLERINLYDDIFPGIDRLVSELYGILSVSQIELIVPAVNRLVRERQNLILDQINQDRAQASRTPLRPVTKGP